MGNKSVKKCRLCGVKKEATEDNFSKLNRYTGGFKHECKECVRKINKSRNKPGEWLKMIIG